MYYYYQYLACLHADIYFTNESPKGTVTAAAVSLEEADVREIATHNT